MEVAERFKLRNLQLHRYRKALNLSVDLDDCALLIGPNSSGKSTILDALRFLSTAAATATFWGPVAERGGMTQLAWKGATTQHIRLVSTFIGPGGTFTWTVTLRRPSHQDFRVDEDLTVVPPGGGESQLLHRDDFECWWRPSPAAPKQGLTLRPVDCALAIAARLEGFPGHGVHETLLGWTFSDPNPGVLRMPVDPGRAWGQTPDLYGRDLPTRLLRFDDEARQQVLQMVRDVTGIPLKKIDVTELDDGRIAFSVLEEGLMYPVNQQALSAGTLRTLAIAVAVADATASQRTTLLAVEEPENYLHPAAIHALGIILAEASSRIQVLISTHSPQLMDAVLPEAGQVLLVGSSPGLGTKVKVVSDRTQFMAADAELSPGQWFLLHGFGPEKE